MIRNHPEYERGYSDGYNTGFNRALENQIDAAQKSSQPNVTIIANTEVIKVAQSQFAAKVLRAIKAEQLQENLDNESDNEYRSAINHVLDAIHRLCAKEGVEVEEGKNGR